MRSQRPASGPLCLSGLSGLTGLCRPTGLSGLCGLLAALAIALCVTGSAGANPQASISHLIAAASAGDTLRIPAGEYRENAEIVVDKPLTLLGSPGAVLYGSDTHGILLVTADRVTISGFVLRDVGTSFMDDRAAIQIEGATNCVISDNTFENNFFAIYVAQTAGCSITNCIWKGPMRTRSPLVSRWISLTFSSLR